MNLAEIMQLIHDRVENVKQLWATSEQTRSDLSVFMRPKIGPSSKALRQVLEPIIAASALLILVSLAGLGTGAIIALAVAMLAMIIILRFVFGIEMTLADMPPNSDFVNS